MDSSNRSLTKAGLLASPTARGRPNNRPSNRSRPTCAGCSSRTESIELRGIERAGGAPVVLLPLETAYVPLRARPCRAWRAIRGDAASDRAAGVPSDDIEIGGLGHCPQRGARARAIAWSSSADRVPARRRCCCTWPGRWRLRCSAAI
ncbi:MAG: hypothetical protein M0C28_24930 [Candidatus Moduliflexus flocculans]|nr:hypothetical protein [Candidatus Moduliflexus flocculans]